VGVAPPAQLLSKTIAAANAANDRAGLPMTMFPSCKKDA
jgi:hypothetical protein